MSASEWLQRGVSRLLPATSSAELSAGQRAAVKAKVGASGSAADTRAPRSLSERMEATLRRHGEGLAPRALRKALQQLLAVVDARVSEVEGGRRAAELAQPVVEAAKESAQQVQAELKPAAEDALHEVKDVAGQAAATTAETAKGAAEETRGSATDAAAAVQGEVKDDLAGTDPTTALPTRPGF